MASLKNVPMTATDAKMAPSVARSLHECFEDWLGTPAQSEQEIVHLVEAGLPLKVVSHLIQQGLLKEELFRIIINPRTLKHRKSKRQPLSREESERAVRTVRIISRAQSVLGSRQKALAWLRAPKRRFEGAPPWRCCPRRLAGGWWRRC